MKMSLHFQPANIPLIISKFIHKNVKIFITYQLQLVDMLIFLLLLSCIQNPSLHTSDVHLPKRKKN